MLSSVDMLQALKNGDIEITPFDEVKLGPCSYDLTLGNLIRFVEYSEDYLDLCDIQRDYSFPVDLNSLTMGGKIALHPGQSMLATTKEIIGLGNQYSAQIHSKSSLGRLMQTVTAGGAGFCDAGFRGEVTLEIVNLMPRPVIYRAGMLIAQITFDRLLSPVEVDYRAKGQYSDQSGPTESKSIKMG